VFALFDPHFRAYSLDEASLHLSPYLAKHPNESPEQVAERMRAMVNERTQLTCSIGTF
jgi:nucleotidyltransferase/DNA polymerase involved in DNA repair